MSHRKVLMRRKIEQAKRAGKGNDVLIPAPIDREGQRIVMKRRSLLNLIEGVKAHA